MPGSHSAHRKPSHRSRRARRWPVLAGGLAVVGLLAGLLSGVAWWRSGTAEAADPCPGPATRLAAAPEVAPAVRDLLEGSGCTSVAVEAASAGEVSVAVSRGRGPDYWIPDSSVWGSGTRLLTLAPTLAASPVVVAHAGSRSPRTWGAVVADPGFVSGDPTGDAASALAITLGSGAVAEDRSAELLAPLAQRSLDSGATSTGQRLAHVARGRGTTVASEQAVHAAGADLAVAVPRRGTAFLDYPLLATFDQRGPTADFLAERLTSTSARASFVDLGFRTSTTSAVTAPKGGAGDVDVASVDPAQVQAARSQWALFSAPSRSIALLDISGSMQFDTAAGTRIELARAAAADGLGLFPDAAEVGLWAFSERLEGRQDHRVITPVAALGAASPDGDHRQSLLRGLDALPGQVGGGTGLYDSVLAAYEALARDHEEGAFHSLLVFTDGSDDDPGGIGEQALLSRLRALYAETPVRVVAIGISADADADALAAIARATDGVSYVATRPEDVRNVFVAALGGPLGSAA